MTFEEFYASEVAPGLPSDFPPALAAQAKKQLAVCWNAALDAEYVQMRRILRRAREPQNPPITSLSIWVDYYETLVEKSQSLIRAKVTP